MGDLPHAKKKNIEMNADRVNELYMGLIFSPETQRACRERIHWICGQAEGSRILDIGCSQGIVCLILGREGFQCTGIDIEQGSIDYARNELLKEGKIVQKHVRFEIADAAKLSFEDSSFDTVILGEIIEHLTNPRKVLREAKRVLKKNGKIVITTPYGLNPHHDHKRTYYPLSFLTLVQPLFQTKLIDTLNNYILYTGTNDPAYNFSRVQSDTLLSEYTRLLEKVEQRCHEKEVSLYETSTKLYDQIKKQGEQIDTLRKSTQDQRELLLAKERDFASALEAKAKEVIEIQRKHTDALIAKERSAVASLALKEKELKETLDAKENELHETSTKLNDQIKRQGEEIDKLKKSIQDQREALLAKERDFASALGAKAKEVIEIERKHTDALIAKERDAVASLALKEKELKETLDAKENEYREELSRKEREAQKILAARERQFQDLLTARLAEHRSALAARTKEIQDTLAKKEREFNEIASQHEKKLREEKELHEQSLKEMVAQHEKRLREEKELSERSLKEMVAQHEKGLQEEKELHEQSLKQTITKNDEDRHRALANLESDLRSNRRWRVGELLVNPVELAVDFIKHPIQTVRRSIGHISRGEFPKSLGTLSVRSVAVGRNGQPGPSSMDVTPAVVARVEIQTPRTVARPSKRTKVAAVLDEFSGACFAPECDLITFRPDNWKTVVEECKPELLLVESAWRGNDGSWQYKVASYQKPMGEELVDLVNYCKSHGIPAVFWNKEDPPNFDRFIHRAPLFDYVFTSDANCIPKYRERVGHDRVFALPFGAQPKLHNPIIEKPREHNICFAGAYYNISFDERKKDMDLVLKPALDFGLHIYDRQHGITGPLAEQFRFPDIYQSAIKGRLEYDDMVKAYKRYKVFLNVNSVKDSPTMFSRRVFELLACGTPVVSAYARGIEEMLGNDIVLLTRSEEETHNHLDRILKNDDEWLRLSVRGIRKVLDAHTYGHRFDQLLHKIGLSSAGSRLSRVTVIARPESPNHLHILGYTLKQQTYRDMDILLFPGKLVKESDIEAFTREMENCPVKTFAANTNVLATIARAADGDYLWFINWRDYYAPEFLKDVALAAVYSDADIIGKHSHFELAANGSTIEFKDGGHEFMRVESVVPGSALVRRGSLSDNELTELLANRTLNVHRKRAFSTDRFNFLRNASISEGIKSSIFQQLVSKIQV